MPSSISSSHSEASDVLDDEGWEDAEPDEEVTHFISLLDDEVFTDIMSMLNHCTDKYKFDFLDTRQRLGLDFYGTVKFVNFIRSQVHSGLAIPEPISRDDFEDEIYLKPVLEDDALLFTLDELPEVHDGIISGNKVGGSSTNSRALISRISELEEELRRTQSQFDDYRTTVKQTLDERWNDKTPRPSALAAEEERDDDSHYFKSYSYNGQY